MTAGDGAAVPFHDEFFSREYRYTLGTEVEAGRRYLAIPVSNGLVDYEEYYALDESEYREFLDDTASAARFADSCRRHEQEQRLLVPPGRNRGTPV